MQSRSARRHRQRGIEALSYLGASIPLTCQRAAGRVLDQIELAVRSWSKQTCAPLLRTPGTQAGTPLGSQHPTAPDDYALECLMLSRSFFVSWHTPVRSVDFRSDR